MASYDDPNYLYEEYVAKGRSPGNIAKEWSERLNKKIYSNTIRRALKRHNFQLRDKSAAQKNYLAKNPHPLEGVKRSSEERKKISEGIQRWWDGLTPDEAEKIKEELSERAGQKWGEMTEDERRATIKKMHSASRTKAGKGGRNENKVARLLEQGGFGVMQRSNQFTPRNLFEIDIAIPSRKTAIEWDGRSHFEPIYGEESLSKTQAKDERKNKVLVKAGWVVIRVRDYSTAHSLAFCRRAVKQIVTLMDNKPKPGVYILKAE